MYDTPPLSSVDTQTVLIAEDDEVVSSLLANALQQHGYSVCVTHNGIEALAWLHRQHTLPKLILLDITMPYMDGITFRRHQKQDPRLAYIPVVPLTGSIDWRELAQGLCFCEYIAKPVLIADVLEVVARYCL